MPLEDLVIRWFPHGYCLSWDYRLIFASVTADWAIFLSYFTIAGVISYAYLKEQTQYLLTPSTCTLWACFILSCGVTHMWSGFVVWYAIYLLDVITKWVTAVISMYTALVCFMDIRNRVADGT